MFIRLHSQVACRLTSVRSSRRERSLRILPFNSPSNGLQTIWLLSGRSCPISKSSKAQRTWTLRQKARSNDRKLGARFEPSSQDFRRRPTPFPLSQTLHLRSVFDRTTFRSSNLTVWREGADSAAWGRSI